MLTELRYAIRALRSGRMFSAVAVLCLALGIATNTTMFSVFDAMFLRRAPFQDIDTLVAVSGRHPETGRRVALSLDDARDLATVQSLSQIAAYSSRTATLTGDGEPERVGTQLVTANLFTVLGEQPQRGHGFTLADDQTSAPGVALISDALWQRRYQAADSAIGRTIRLDNTPYTIVGVMPPKFRFPSSTDIWTPIRPALTPNVAATRSVSLIARLAPGAAIERANSELMAHVMPAKGSRAPRTGFARAFGSTSVGSEERTITGALMGATTVLLMIACVNVANLLLARGAGRRREIAIRAAIGASRARIARQLLTESVVLAAASAAVALPLAWYGIRWVHDAVPPTDPLGPYYVDWSLDLRTLAYTLAVALVTGLAFGLAPALDASGPHLLSPLREGAGAASGRVQRRVHKILIVAQTALALVLLAGASLFVRTYAGLHQVELGYDMSHLMTMRVFMTGTAYDSEDARSLFVDQLAMRLESLPGAHASTVTDLVPLDDQGGSDSPAAVEGRVFEKGHDPTVQFAGVAGRWPETFDVRLMAGRTFTPEELQQRAPVALVNHVLAETFWPGESPLGRRFKLTDDEANPWLTVIGVVPDIRTVKLDESRATPPTAYLPHRFISTRSYGIVVRTQSSPESVTPGVKAAVHSIDPSLALYDVYSMSEVRWLSYWMYVMWGTMFGVLGAIALVIAAIGVYGVVFYTVAQRTREIGLRVALGAARTQIVGPMLRQVALLSAIGVAIGIAGAIVITPVVGSLLIGVKPNDVTGFVVVSALLALVGLAATWIPAWRASAVDPMVALRD